MKLLKQYSLAIFWALLFIDCFLINFTSSQSYRIYTKPFLLIILATYFYINTRKSKHSNSKRLVYSGLLCCWLADWLFLKNDLTIKYEGDIYLISGIVLMLLGYSMYTMLFKKMGKINIKDCQEAFLAFLAMLIVSIIYYSILKKENLGHFHYLIIVGIVAITIMMVYAANIYHDKVRKNMAMQFFIPGTITLIIAMGIVIAYRFLLQDGDFLPAVIELTYGFGQMLLIKGFSKYLKA